MKSHLKAHPLATLFSLALGVLLVAGLAWGQGITPGLNGTVLPGLGGGGVHNCAAYTTYDGGPVICCAGYCTQPYATYNPPGSYIAPGTGGNSADGGVCPAGATVKFCGDGGLCC